jgi:hypothetical protein
MDSIMGGHSFFITDPQLNIAKTLLAVISFLSEFIILIQIYIYANHYQNTQVQAIEVPMLEENLLKGLGEDKASILDNTNGMNSTAD